MTAAAGRVIAPVYMRLGHHFDDAVRALRNVIRLNGPSSAGARPSFGEAQVAAANGVVTAEAKAAYPNAR